MPRLTKDQYEAIIAKAGYSPVATGVSRPVPQQVERTPLLADQEGSGQSPSCPVVIITRCSTGSLDRDNLWASSKAIVDALRYSGRIPGDTEQHIEQFTFQRKVKKKDVGTLIEIISMPTPSC